MTKQELLTFIYENYADDEQLLFQIVSADDFADQEDFDYDTWDEFVEKQERYTELADNYTHEVRNALIDFIEEEGN